MNTWTTICSAPCIATRVGLEPLRRMEKMPEWIPKHDIKAVFKEVIPVILVLELAAIESICDLQGLKDSGL